MDVNYNLGVCDKCKNGCKLQPTKPLGEKTKFRQWESIITDKNDDNQQNEVNSDDEEIELEEKKKQKKKTKLQINCREVYVGVVLEEFQADFSMIVNHINVKRIQAAEFERDKNDEKKRVVQIDYAMNFTSEWQDEIQSALWHRCSVTLFTIAIYGKDFEKTALICSDTKCKNMSSTWAFLDHIYKELIDMSDDKSKNMEEVIWSDGPTSEFKNRFMVQVCLYLSERYKKPWTWKFSATSHGKGVVDRIGGKAKSLVRTKMFAKRKKDRIIVQTPFDFFKAANKLMTKTKVEYVSQESIDMLNTTHPLTSAKKIKEITKAHVIKVDGKSICAWKNSGYKEPFILYEDEEVKAPVSTKETATLLDRTNGRKIRKQRICSDEDDNDVLRIKKIKNSILFHLRVIRAYSGTRGHL